MKIERGYIYELAEGWRFLRVVQCYKEYESFNPDIVGDFYVSVVKVGEDGEHTPFRMKREMFEELVLDEHGYSVPEEPKYPEQSHQELHK